jgi:hypothetical protein
VAATAYLDGYVTRTLLEQLRYSETGYELRLGRLVGIVDEAHGTHASELVVLGCVVERQRRAFS